MFSILKLRWSSFCQKLMTLACMVIVGYAVGLPAQASSSLRLAEYQKQEWQVEDGLPESNVRMITQRADGQLLLATFSGVSTFDGQNFRALPMFAGSTANTDAINAVLSEANGTLWIGTDGSGVLRLTANGVENISAAAGHRNERIRTMCIDQEGALWIATQWGVERYRNGRFESLPGAGIIGGDLTTVFASDMHGGMFFVTNSGIFHWAGGALHVIALPARFGQPVALYRDRNARLWVGTMHALLEAFPSADGNVFRAEKRMALASQANAMASDRDGNLWVGTKLSGLYRWNATGSSSWTRRDGLADNTIRTLFVDDEDNLWIGGLTGGLSRWRRAPFMMLKESASFQPSYASVVFSDSRNDLWLGTWGQGVFRVHQGTMARVPLPGMPITGGIRAITEDTRHRIWIGTWFDGIYAVDRGHVRHYLLGTESPVNAVSTLLSDAHGGLWVGTYTGLVYFPSGEPQHLGGVHVLASKLVTCLLEDVDGSILVGTTSGLFRVHGQNTQQVQGMPHPYVLSLSKDSSGTVWAGPRSGGLARVARLQATLLPKDAGLPLLPVYNMLEDEHKHLWMGTSLGVVRVSAPDLTTLLQGKIKHITSVLFGKADGMPSSDCSGPSRPSAARLPDGTLVFATNRGFVQTTSFAEHVMLSTPQAHILGWTFSTDSNPENYLSLKRVDIRPSEQDITFFFDAKLLANPRQIEFRYRLAGYDSGWITTHARYARYHRIVPGTYTFEVQARNAGEPWTTQTSSLPVQQHPHIYATYTFYILIAILATALGVHLYMLRIRHAKGHMGIVLEERSRIARECHDTLMAGFAAVAWQLDAARHAMPTGNPHLVPATEAMTMARSMVTHCQAEARRIIWDLRETDEVTGILSQALARSIGELQRPRDVELKMAVEGKEILLPPASVHHLICITQEAVNNALRHAHPTLMIVHLLYSERSIKLLIRDNGSGFSATQRNSSERIHFGLLVMEERARKIGGHFSITSNARSGTEVQIEIPYSTFSAGDPDVGVHAVRWLGL
jgi:signal transduction histidine kinase/ligand-binding sensor domain-containing protein